MNTFVFSTITSLYFKDVSHTMTRILCEHTLYRTLLYSLASVELISDTRTQKLLT